MTPEQQSLQDDIDRITSIPLRDRTTRQHLRLKELRRKLQVFSYPADEKVQRLGTIRTIHMDDKPHVDPIFERLKAADEAGKLHFLDWINEVKHTVIQASFQTLKRRVTTTKIKKSDLVLEIGTLATRIRVAYNNTSDTRRYPSIPHLDTHDLVAEHIIQRLEVDMEAVPTIIETPPSAPEPEEKPKRTRQPKLDAFGDEIIKPPKSKRKYQRHSPSEMTDPDLQERLRKAGAAIKDSGAPLDITSGQEPPAELPVHPHHNPEHKLPSPPSLSFSHKFIPVVEDSDLPTDLNLGNRLVQSFERVEFDLSAPFVYTEFQLRHLTKRAASLLREHEHRMRIHEGKSPSVALEDLKRWRLLRADLDMLESAVGTVGIEFFDNSQGGVLFIHR